MTRFAHLDMRDLYALAYLEGLARKAERPQERPAPAPRLDDTGRAPAVPLRAMCGHVGPRGTACIETAGHRGSHGDGTVLRWIVRG